MLDPRLPWIAGYIVLALLPGALSMLLGAPPWRDPIVEVAVAMGFVGLALFVLQFVSTGRFPRWLGPLGMDGTMRLHRWAGLLATALVLAHPVLLLARQPAYWAFLDPRANAPRAFALIAGLGALLIVSGGPFLKQRLNLDHGWWRLTHGILAGALVVIGTAHVLMVGHFAHGPLQQGLWLLLAFLAANLWVETRVLRPLRRRRAPWRVSSVTFLCDRSWALALEAEGHAGLDFRAGQFVWLTLGDSVFSLEEHPFSLSSSAEEPARIEFAIKELGDFTRTIGQVQPGTRAHLEGPYGTFALPPDELPLVLIAGGIGIAPMISMLRTLRDRQDRRPVVLLVGTESLAKAAFQPELDELCEPLELRVMRVLEAPPADWQGERGFIDAPLLERVLGRPLLERAHVFLCGPVPMMKAVMGALHSLGVPRKRIRGERFDMF